jgi:excisionase family DNA binding protein
MPKSKRGFASMSHEQRRSIASMGGITAHAKGLAHQFTKEEASRAGRLGGTRSQRKEQHTQRREGPPKPWVKFSSEKPKRTNALTYVEQDYVTPKEAARQLRVSYKTLQRWIESGSLAVETVRQGKRSRYFIKKAVVEQHLKQPVPNGLG